MNVLGVTHFPSKEEETLENMVGMLGRIVVVAVAAAERLGMHQEYPSLCDVYYLRFFRRRGLGTPRVLRKRTTQSFLVLPPGG